MDEVVGLGEVVKCKSWRSSTVSVIASIRWTIDLFYRIQPNMLSVFCRRFGVFATTDRFVSRCIWYVSSHCWICQAMGWLTLSESYALCADNWPKTSP